MDKVSILGVDVCVVDSQALTRNIVDTVRRHERRVFPYVNIYAVNIAYRNPRFRQILNDGGNAYCDGEGVRLGAGILGRRLPPRIVLTYYYWELCEALEREGVSIFLLGAQADLVGRAVEETRRRHPRLVVAGYHHGYFEKQGKESEEIVRQVNDSGADVLFVGFGMPLQEYWIAENAPRLNVHAILPCGSMIDYAAGARHLTPRWMGDHGLEWLYRLIQEPSRLWTRYLIGNPLFVLRVLHQRVMKREA
jgi:N-acetylglucosaminyldiphosphoundecaprenol N-acetyl-beta-D-mannosaminyltransferase